MAAAYRLSHHCFVITQSKVAYTYCQCRCVCRSYVNERSVNFINT